MDTDWKAFSIAVGFSLAVAGGPLVIAAGGFLAATYYIYNN